MGSVDGAVAYAGACPLHPHAADLPFVQGPLRQPRREWIRTTPGLEPSGPYTLTRSSNEMEGSAGIERSSQLVAPEWLPAGVAVSPLTADWSSAGSACGSNTAVGQEGGGRDGSSVCRGRQR
jgi:hypothetical protein